MDAWTYYDAWKTDDGSHKWTDDLGDHQDICTVDDLVEAVCDLTGSDYLDMCEYTALDLGPKWDREDGGKEILVTYCCERCRRRGKMSACTAFSWN